MNIVKDIRALRQDFIPEQVLARRDVLQKTETVFRGDGISSTIILKGNPGTGKTLIARYLIKSHPNYHGYYVNCYLTPSDRAIISELITGGTFRGDLQSAGMERLTRLLMDSLPQDRNFIVLDEAQSLRRSNASIVYLLSRSLELGGPPIKLMILTIEDPEMFMDKSTLAGIGTPKIVTLQEYNAEELNEILKQRTVLSLYEGMYTESAISLIAELSEDTGSARVAIELLNRSIQAAERNGTILDEASVLTAYKEFSPPIEENSLLDLEEWELALLSKLIENSTDSKFRASELKSLVPDQNDSRIYRFLRHLENSGFIKKTKVGKGYGGGVENEYVFRIPPKMLEERVNKAQKTIH
ncbi:MAG: AAA family ATPase [Candidatus Thermoplasmatota archaeon]|jgi:Cdc6-like AAA superfamily ATPase|nr:AAA family ATPase [Candidatus Thermoplasmatota archaeon]